MSGYRCCEHCARGETHEPWADGHDDPCWFHQCHGADWLATPPSSPVETTAGLLGHCPACHSPMYGPCGTCISKANTAGTTYEVQRLMGETQRLKRVNANLAETHRRNRDRIAERDATIERLTAQLNEATNVPAVKRCLACNDPHCTAGKP